MASVSEALPLASITATSPGDRHRRPYRHPRPIRPTPGRFSMRRRHPATGIIIRHSIEMARQLSGFTPPATATAALSRAAAAGALAEETERLWLPAGAISSATSPDRQRDAALPRYTMSRGKTKPAHSHRRRAVPRPSDHAADRIAPPDHRLLAACLCPRAVPAQLSAASTPWS